MSNLEEHINEYSFEGDVDAVNPEKFAFRREAMTQDRRRRKVIELRAGVGYLTSRVYARAYQEVVAVEKDPAHFRRLLKRAGRFSNVRFYNKADAEFIEDDLLSHMDFSAVDCDAFGAPGETVTRFFEAVGDRAPRPFLLLLTDGGLLALRRRAPINLYRYYLLGDDEVKVPAADLAGRLEEVQEGFVTRLAARHDYTVRPVGARRNHGETALYSAYVIF
jgi:hypothetical protein